MVYVSHVCIETDDLGKAKRDLPPVSREALSRNLSLSFMSCDHKYDNVRRYWSIITLHPIIVCVLIMHIIVSCTYSAACVCNTTALSFRNLKLQRQNQTLLISTHFRFGTLPFVTPANGCTLYM